MNDPLLQSGDDGNPLSNTGRQRRVTDAGRLNVELRLVGLVGLLWMAALVHAMAWVLATAARGQAFLDLPWNTLLIPQLIALVVVLATMCAQLPGARWARRGSLVRTPSHWPLLLLGFPGLIAAPFLLRRDRRERTRARPPTDGQIQDAFYRLVRVPRVAGMQFLVWTGLAYVADAIALGLHFDWPRPVVVVLAVLWLAILGPLAALIASRGRAILRPEYLTAPRNTDEEFRRTANLGLKLGVNASIASLGAVAAPLAAGYLWMWSHAAEIATADARELAQSAHEMLVGGEEKTLGRLLVENQHLGLIDGSRRYGRPLPIESFGIGVNDTDGDGVVDLLLHREGRVTVGVFMDAPRLVPADLLVFSGIFCVAFAIGAVVLLARDVRRDVVRASNQVDAVSRGSAPAPLTRGSFATREIRQLVQSVDRLVNRITETNVAKYVAIEKAKEADRLKSQFLANMSHDLRSPLNSILGFSELLVTGIDGELMQADKDLVQIINDSGSDLLQQIDDILDTAKIDAGRMELHPEPTPPATIASKAITNARKRLRKDINFVTEASPGLPTALVDTYRTVQALENVLLFASERMESGQLTVSLRPSLSERGQAIDVRVATPVRPASAEQLRRAREGFTRLPGHKGLGLGLLIANAILELQGGRLEIEDGPDAMVFTLRLPSAELRRAPRGQATA